MRLIETDSFPFEFLSHLAERESWRKEIHRPIYHVHKWWAKRLGSIFRGMLLGCSCPPTADLAAEFYKVHSFSNQAVFDPFMGSGTTVGEAHKLGFTALGRDINPVAVEAVSTALGPMDRRKILQSFDELSAGVGARIRALYRSSDAGGHPCNVLYYFWVMQATCPDCANAVDLFPSFVIARNAAPDRKPEVQVVCPSCGEIFPALNAQSNVQCPGCRGEFNPSVGSAQGAKAVCRACKGEFTILRAMAPDGPRPSFRLYGKLVLTGNDEKQYLRADANDLAAFNQCSQILQSEISSGRIQPPHLQLAPGFNTRQAMRYGFNAWRDFFNDRQLLALGWLKNAISEIVDVPTRRALLTLFSGTLEFNNLFASYKGEGTGAVRHMFSHHILKPERTPIEANVWGTARSSGSFSTLLRGRLLRAIDYREAPVEVNGKSGMGRVCASAFSGCVESRWPENAAWSPRGIYLSCGDSSATGLPGESIDLVVTDPPFFDNVQYSELADFFYAWQQSGAPAQSSTRSMSEVQDSNAERFADKLCGVFQECHRILRGDGLLVFTYHHSRDEGWASLAQAILGADFAVVNAHPVKAEMSVATPKSQTKEPIQLDIIIVCRKRSFQKTGQQTSSADAMQSGKEKVKRLIDAGFSLSRNDRKIVLYGQLLTTLSAASDLSQFTGCVEDELLVPMGGESRPSQNEGHLLLFE